MNTKQPLPTGRERGTERREASERVEVSRRHSARRGKKWGKGGGRAKFWELGSLSQFGFLSPPLWMSCLGEK